MQIRTLLAIVALVFAGGSHAGPLAYNEAANAKLEVEQALSAAKSAGRPVLIIFGANWCEDCRALDRALKIPRNADLLAKEFLMVKVDVGNFDRNLDLAELYGNPIKKGIPAALVLSPRNEILYTTRLGELSNARRMSEFDIHEFLQGLAATTKTRQ